MTYSRTEKLRTPMPKSSSRERPRVGVSSQKKKPVGDGINQTAGDFDAISLATQYQIASRSASTCAATGGAISDAIARLPDGIDPAVSSSARSPKDSWVRTHPSPHAGERPPPRPGET